jgi:hypothetical protein
MADSNRISYLSSGRSNLLPIQRLAEYPAPMRANWARSHRGPWLPLPKANTHIHAWLMERIAAIDYERHGLWPRTNRLLRAIARFMLWPFVCKVRFNND